MVFFFWSSVLELLWGCVHVSLSLFVCVMCVSFFLASLGQTLTI